jgi:CubicO group peptidase (beta-lactamase class C family)
MQRRTFIRTFGSAAIAPLCSPVWTQESRRQPMGTPAKTSEQDDGWLVAQPDAVGMNADVLSGLAPQFESWSDANLHAALMVRHGQLVYERYFAGEDTAWGTPLGRIAFHAGLRHDLRSITKSITSILFGVICDRGLIKSLDEPVFSYFPEMLTSRLPRKRKSTFVTSSRCRSVWRGMSTFLTAIPPTANGA